MQITWAAKADQYLTPIQKAQYEAGVPVTKLVGRLSTDVDGNLWYAVSGCMKLVGHGAIATLADKRPAGPPHARGNLEAPGTEPSDTEPSE
jgi:hypothetical protein